MPATVDVRSKHAIGAGLRKDTVATKVSEATLNSLSSGQLRQVSNHGLGSVSFISMRKDTVATSVRGDTKQFDTKQLGSVATKVCEASNSRTRV